MAATVFLLSPAHAGGKRALQIADPASAGGLARRLHGGESVTLGELFSFLSGLYFRGKLAYAARFAAPEHILVITPHQGLLPADTRISLDEFRSFSTVSIDAADPQYRRPLEIDLAGLAARPGLSRFVLLGSLASGKYVDVIAPLLAGRLFYPVPFPGRGDMSRGSLLLRHARLGNEMEYAPLERLFPPAHLRISQSGR